MTSHQYEDVEKSVQAQEIREDEHLLASQPPSSIVHGRSNRANGTSDREPVHVSLRFSSRSSAQRHGLAVGLQNEKEFKEQT